MNDERREALTTAVEALFVEYQDVLSPDIGLPSPADWVLIVTFDDVANARHGNYYRLNPPGQWSHRTAGLLQSAADDYRKITNEEED